jgi:hypothetical protein
MMEIFLVYLRMSLLQGQESIFSDNSLVMSTIIFADATSNWVVVTYLLTVKSKLMISSALFSSRWLIDLLGSAIEVILLVALTGIVY